MPMSSFTPGFALLAVAAYASPVQMHIYSLEMLLFSAFAPCLHGFLKIELSSSFVTVRDKNLIKLRYIAKAGVTYFGKLPPSHKYFMTQNRLVETLYLLMI